MRSTYKIQEDGTYFVTSTVVEWVPLFDNKKFCDILIEGFDYYQKRKGLEIYAYVIMDTHFHLVCYSSNLTNAMRAIKSYTAKLIIEILIKNGPAEYLDLFRERKKSYKSKSQYQIWQEGFHPKLILNDEVLIQKVEYIHANPVKKGLVECPEDWIYSSARNYMAMNNYVMEISKLEL